MSLRKATAGAVSLFAGVFISLMSGCGGNTSIGPGANTTSNLRSINALVCANYNSINIAQRTSTANIAIGLVYGQNTAYSTVPSGNGVNDFAVQNTTVVAQSANDLQPNASYTLVATGDCSQAADSIAPSLIQFTDSPPTSAQLGSNVGLRVINVVPVTTAGYQAIDVYNAGLPLTNLTNIAYGNASVYATLPAATYNLTLHSHANNGLLTLPAATATALASLSLSAGHSYTLLIYGTTSAVPNEAFNVKVITDN